MFASSYSAGVTEAVGWKGGGGFRYYWLAPSLLEKDKWGNWVINKKYNVDCTPETGRNMLEYLTGSPTPKTGAERILS